MTKKQFYFLSFTWGLIMNIIGGAAALVLMALGYKPRRFRGCLRFTVGHNRGGVSLGLVIITGRAATEDTLKHECGHSLQNAAYGVLFPFVVAIPSFVRCWIRKIKHKAGKPPKTTYDAVWFEAQATEWGNKYFN